MSTRSRTPEEVAVAAASKAVWQSLRRHAPQGKTAESEEELLLESAEESINVGMLRSFLKGLTLGRDSAHGSTFNVSITPHLYERAEIICRNFERTNKSAAFNCHLTNTHGNWVTQFVWSSAPESPEELVRSGYPIKVADILANLFQIRTLDLLTSVGVPPRTAARRVSEDGILKADESDRLFRAGDIMCRALEVFGDVEHAREFLTMPNPSIGGSTPLALLDTVPGRDRVINLLGQIEHGVYA
jgi:putative toxin-antitoxin system antitoxin component (TIGR02293 family)